MKIYEVLWDEDEYGYAVAMDPPLVFTTRELAEKAAKQLPGIGLGNGYIVLETELLDAMPDDLANRRDIASDDGHKVIRGDDDGEDNDDGDDDDIPMESEPGCPWWLGHINL